MEHTATYSPDDNKLRIYPACRLDTEEYQRLKSAGFSWAPKQECFFTAWSPSREDAAIALAGEIDDEDRGLLDRATDRAERFEGYRGNRQKDAAAAEQAVSAIADNIPLGQPILIGHHSERRARKDAEKIENGMRRAIKAWETAEYWRQRAAAAIAHAKYKERPAVRARRIKTIEADRDRVLRSFTPYAKAGKVLQEPWHCPKCNELFCKVHPEAKEKVVHVWTGHHGRGGSWTPETSLPAIEARSQRWLAHYDRRLEYEKAMLEGEGQGDLLKPKERPTAPPLLNYPAAVVVVENPWRRGEVETLEQVNMTKAEYAKVHPDNKGTRNAGTHRVRVAITWGENHKRNMRAVFLTDSKAHPAPEQFDWTMPEATAPAPRQWEPAPRVERPGEGRVEAMREALREGVKVVVAPQLFPTPPELAAKMIAEAQIGPGMDVLEPSAGTGRLLDALPTVRPGGSVVAVEIRSELEPHLRPHADRVVIGDFMQMIGQLGKFDRVIMNPPFADGQDIAHIQRAASYLKPGGVLVALCANGPRQQAALIPWAEHRMGWYRVLPAGSFQSEGTSVNVAMLKVRAAG